jgi:hypothetical protein
VFLSCSYLLRSGFLLTLMSSFYRHALLARGGFGGWGGGGWSLFYSPTSTLTFQATGKLGRGQDSEQRECLQILRGIDNPLGQEEQDNLPVESPDPVEYGMYRHLPTGTTLCNLVLSGRGARCRPFSWHGTCVQKSGTVGFISFSRHC